MELAKYKACICEGSAEEAIIDILVDNDLLIFKREEMLEECVIRCRSAKRFEERYLRKGFDEQISVIRILDSRREEFRLSKAYEQKIDVVNVIITISVRKPEKPDICPAYQKSKAMGSRQKQNGLPSS